MYVIYELIYICHRFCGRHFGSPGGNIVAKIVQFYSQNIFRKSHQNVPLNSERFRNGSEKVGLGVILPPGQGRVKRSELSSAAAFRGYSIGYA